MHRQKPNKSEIKIKKNYNYDFEEYNQFDNRELEKDADNDSQDESARDVNDENSRKKDNRSHMRHRESSTENIYAK